MQKPVIHPWLDLIRYVASLLVVVGHFRADLFLKYNDLPATQQNLPMQLVYCMTSLGHVCVLIFFALSGYLVGGGLLHKLKTSQFDCASYSIDRFTRIQLPLFSTMILIAIGNWIMGINEPFSYYILNFFSLQGVCCKPLAGPLWSLAYEVWFYVLGGFLVALVTLKSPAKKTFAFLVILISMLILYRLGIVYTFLWFMGAFASEFNLKKSNIILVTLSIMGMIVFTLLGLHVFSSKLGIENGSIVAQAITLGFGLSSCLFIMNIIHLEPSGRLALWLNSIGTKMAKFSYTLYLTHWTVLLLMQYWLKTESSDVNAYSVSLFFFGILTSHIVAYLFYLPFESQSYRLKIWMKQKIKIISV